MGGVELIVDEVFNCPVWIEGDITTHPHDEPDFTINEAWALIDPDNNEFKIKLPKDYVHAKLNGACFYDKIFPAIKDN